MANSNIHQIENKFLLYHHINPITNIVFYVGIGDNKRPFDHSSRSNWWIDTVSKYGIIVEIISTDLSWKDACEFEILFIRHFGRRDKGLGPLVNMTDGGDGSGGCYPSEETRKKMSDSQKKVDRSLMKQHLKGRKLSTECILKRSKKQSKPVVQLDINGNIINEWTSLKETSCVLNIPGPNLCAMLKGRLKNKYNLKYK